MRFSCGISREITIYEYAYQYQARAFVHSNNKNTNRLVQFKGRASNDHHAAPQGRNYAPQRVMRCTTLRKTTGALWHYGA